MDDTTIRSSRASGCLVGGAVGDALGSQVEFMQMRDIRRQFGVRGIRELQQERDGVALVTDDTQMSLFTAEGLLEWSQRRNAAAGKCCVCSVLHAYHRWLVTQGDRPQTGRGSIYENWSDKEIDAVLSAGDLVHLPRLAERRSPGTTCLSALETGRCQLPGDQLNQSKGCGGVMRIAPVGLLCRDPSEAYDVGCILAAFTHGHPTGFVSAGALAMIISHLMNGKDIRTAAEAARTRALKRPGIVTTSLLQSGRPIAIGSSAGRETADAIVAAIELSESGNGSVPAAVERLGEGWTADEALAIGLYCALVYPDNLVESLRLAVNHSGDSDSTGSICGNLVGATVGDAGLPERWGNHVEFGAELRRYAQRLVLAHESSR